jgi:hypothetical protein
MRGVVIAAKNACELVTQADASKALRTKVNPGKHTKVGPFDTCTYRYRYLELRIRTRPLTFAAYKKSVFKLSGLEFGASEISANAKASYYREHLTVLMWKKGIELRVRITGANEYSMPVVETVAKPALRRI